MKNKNLWGFTGIVATLALLALAEPARAADNPLTLFKTYFGTINDASAGKGVRGTGQLDPQTNEYLATATIDVPVPPNAEIVAAFLYWISMEKTEKPSSARAYLKDPANPAVRTKILGKPLGAVHSAPCWSSGGSTGSSNGAPTLRVYRADVLRRLRTDSTTGQKIPNVTVMVSDTGNGGSKVPLTEGASLVVVYRHPSLPFRSVVIFDGSMTLNNATDSFTQTINGFYQVSKAEPSAKITYVVGDGQANFPELLDFNNKPLGGSNPFAGATGFSWDNLTYDVKIASGASSVTTKVYHGAGSFDCLSWGAVVFSVNVEDSDEDGLLDAWEEPAGFTNLLTGTHVNLYDLGARNGQKDLFVQLDYMVETKDDALGKPHSHLPKKEALDMVGKAFLNAPKAPNGPGPIYVHFDVGSNYQTVPPDPYIVPANKAKGGNAINERSASTFCTRYVPEGELDDRAHCLLPNQPGLVSWKKGIQHIENNFLDDDRRSVFHYVLFGHALASKGAPLESGGFAARSISGRADLPGNSVTITLGRWRSSAADEFVGSKDLQGATLLHELSHNLWGFHGGITIDRPLTIDEAIVPRPNCNPNKQSVLNYLYQSSGLLDKDGNFTVDLSREYLTAQSGAQNENALDEFKGLSPGGNTAYRLRWYALLSAVQARLGITPTAPKAHCNGTPIDSVVETPMVRVDGLGIARSPVDWNYNRTTNDNPRLDINFNGSSLEVTDAFKGFNDWKSIAELHGLQQVGTGRNLFGLSLGVVSTDLLQAGEDDLGEDDLGEDDLGEDHLGAEISAGEDDLGEDDLGEDDLGEDDLGEDDLGEVGDIDEFTAMAIGTSPTGLTAQATSGRDGRAIVLNWAPPPIGAVVSYKVYRVQGQELVALSALATVTAPATTYTDRDTRNNLYYTYVVTAIFADGTESNISNPRTQQQ